jgi:hypothetical protein
MKLGNGKGCQTNYYCGRKIKHDFLPESNGFCGPNNGPQCHHCTPEPLPINRDGRPMRPGQGGCSGKLYCNRFVGRLPGSDGRCGPTNGPQCSVCSLGPNDKVNNKVAAQVIPAKVLLNRARNVMKPGFKSSNQSYCGMKIYLDMLPYSNGYCGPNNGPQCHDCTPEPLPMNRDGRPMRPGKGRCSDKLYCNRFVGVLPGSDGRCGPTNGPQCKDCIGING